MLVTGESGSVDQCCGPSGCSSCALVLNSLKRSALVYKGEGNASMSEIRIRNDLRGLA